MQNLKKVNIWLFEEINSIAKTQARLNKKDSVDPNDQYQLLEKEKL